MKRLCILLLVVVSLCSVAGCSTIAKTAYGIQHKYDAPLDPNTASGATIIYKKDDITLTNVIDIEYDRTDNTVHYVRRNGQTFVKGVAPYDEVDITIGTRYLQWSTVKDEWEFVDAGRVYDIYQQSYLPITISGEE